MGQRCLHLSPPVCIPPWSTTWRSRSQCRSSTTGWLMGPQWIWLWWEGTIQPRLYLLFTHLNPTYLTHRDTISTLLQVRPMPLLLSLAPTPLPTQLILIRDTCRCPSKCRVMIKCLWWILHPTYLPCNHNHIRWIVYYTRHKVFHTRYKLCLPHRLHS